MSCSQYRRRIGLLAAGSFLLAAGGAMAQTVTTTQGAAGASTDIIDSSTSLTPKDCKYGTYLVRLFVQSGEVGDADCQTTGGTAGPSAKSLVEASIGSKTAQTYEQSGIDPIWVQKIELGCVSPDQTFTMALVNTGQQKTCFSAAIKDWITLQNMATVTGDFKKLSAEYTYREVPFRATSDTGLSWVDMRFMMYPSQQAAPVTNPLNNGVAGLIIFLLLVFVLAFFAAFAYQYRHSLKAWYEHNVKGIKEDGKAVQVAAPEKKGEQQDMA